jgi:hypothetical protein
MQIIEAWPREYNTVHLPSPLGYRPLAPEAWLTSTARQAGMAVATLMPSRCATLTNSWNKTSVRPAQRETFNWNHTTL